MSGAPGANRALRVAAIVLVPAGIVLHLWLGTRIPLIAVAVGLGCHLAAVVLARRWLRARGTTTGPAEP